MGILIRPYFLSTCEKHKSSKRPPSPNFLNQPREQTNTICRICQTIFMKTSCDPKQCSLQYDTRNTTTQETPGELNIKPNFDGYDESIRRLEPDEAHETLGIFIAITNN